MSYRHNFLVFCCISLVEARVFSFQSNAKNLDPSYKMDLDLWDRLGKVKLVAKFQSTDLVNSSLILERERGGEEPCLIAK